MITDIICAKCNGHGYINHYEENRMWSERCSMCNGIGKLGRVSVKEIDVDNMDDIGMVTITRQEYEELLEYKHMYEDLCT